MCFFCLWDRRDDTNQAWKPHENLTVGRFSLKYIPLVNLEKYPSTFTIHYIEADENLCKAMNHDGAAFRYLKAKFGLFKSKAN